MSRIGITFAVLFVIFSVGAGVAIFANSMVAAVALSFSAGYSGAVMVNDWMPR